jgi:hypothetical protein
VTASRRNVLLVAAGTLALLAGLVAHFPARLALAWFAPPALHAWGVEGTVWRGRIAELALEGHGLGALSWQGSPLRLLTLRPAWDFDLRRSDGFVRGEVGIALPRDRQQFRNLEAALSLATLPPAIVPVGVAGQVRLSLVQLTLDNGWPTAIEGRAGVAELDLPGVILTLGPFEFHFPGQASLPLAEIRSLGGPLVVDGRIELPARGQWRLSAELAPGEDPPRELVEGLAFVGEDLGDGRRRLVMSSEP